MELLPVELHGSVGKPRLAQLLGKSVERDEHLGVLTLVSVLSRSGSGLSRAVYNAVVLEQLLHFLVGIPPVAAYDGVRYAVAFHRRLVVKIEYHAVAKLLLVGPERTHEVAEMLRKHRYGAVYEVDARSSFLCLLVYY